MARRFDDLSDLHEMAREHQVGGQHYQKDIQPWEAMEAWFSEEQFKGYLKGNIIKYLARCDDKGGNTDIQKAYHYAQKLQEVAPTLLDFEQLFADLDNLLKM